MGKTETTIARSVRLIIGRHGNACSYGRRYKPCSIATFRVAAPKNEHQSCALLATGRRSIFFPARRQPPRFHRHARQLHDL